MANSYFPIAPAGGVPTQHPKEISETSQYALGTKLEALDGRVWRYCKAGAVQLSPGLMGQTPAIAAEIINEVQTGYTTNIGDTEITVLVTTSSGLTPSDLNGGYIAIEDGTGEGHYYKISSAAWSTDDTVLTINLDEAILVATEATTEVTLYPNIFSGIIVAPTTLTGNVIGVATVTVTANYYYWAQTRGPCGMVVDAADTVVVGEPAGKPGTNGTAGAVGLVAADGTDLVYGRVMSVAGGGETGMIYLMLE